MANRILPMGAERQVTGTAAYRLGFESRANESRSGELSSPAVTAPKQSTGGPIVKSSCDP